MSRQLLVLATAVAVHVTALAVVGHPDADGPTIVRAPRALPAPTPCQPVTSPAVVRDPPAPPVENAPDLDAAFHVIDATHRTVTREAYDWFLANPMEVGKKARIVPSVRDGKPDGFKLYAIAPGGPSEHAGLRNGDTLVTVNGMEMTSADKALETYVRLKQATNLELGIRRGGVPMTLWLEIVGVSDTFIDASIAEQGADHYIIARPLARLLREEPALIEKGARVVPALMHGKPQGMKVYAIRPGSVYAHLGLKNGDTLLRLNGQDLMDPSDPRALARAHEFVLGIQRRGEPHEITIALE